MMIRSSAMMYHSSRLLHLHPRWQRGTINFINICSGAALSPRPCSVWLLVVYQENAYHCRLHLGLNLMHHKKCGGITHPPYVVLYLRRLLGLVPSSSTIYVRFSLSIKMATNDSRRMVLLPSPPPEYFRRSFIFAWFIWSACYCCSF